MALNETVANCYGLVDQVEKNTHEKSKETANSKLFRDLVILNSAFQGATSDISAACQYLNDSLSQIKLCLSTSSIYMGKESAPLLVSVKQLADYVLSTEKINSVDINTKEKLRNNLIIMEENCRKREDLGKSFSRSIGNMEYVLARMKKLKCQEEGVEQIKSSGSTSSLDSEGSSKNVNSHISNADLEPPSFYKEHMIASSPLTADNSHK